MKINRNEEIAILTLALSQLEMREVMRHKIWTSPVGIQVLDCVMSLNRRYSGVEKRIIEFMRRHPDLKSVKDILDLVDSYSSPTEFLRIEMSWNDERRANTIRAVLVTHANNANPEAWANSVRPHEFKAVPIKGFGIAGFQYLRMLFGADTVKPDVHILNFMESILGYRPDPVSAVELFEAACQRLGIKAREADTVIWEAYSAKNPKMNPKGCGAQSVVAHTA